MFKIRHAGEILTVLLALITFGCAHRIVQTAHPVIPPQWNVPLPSNPLPSSRDLLPAQDRIAELQKRIERDIDTSDLPETLWGIKVVSLDNGQTLFEKNSNAVMMPASNMKIVTAAAGLLSLGPDFRTPIANSTSAAAPPLKTTIKKMMKNSVNPIADSIARTIGEAQIQDASYVGAETAIRQIIGSLAPNPEELRMQDGSGLSNHDAVTPNLLLQILVGMYRTPVFDDFYDAFPVAGVDGTLKNRMIATAAQGNVHAKTGYIDHVRSLSGYVTSRDGEHLAFVMIANDFHCPVRWVDSVEETICARLAEFTRR